MKRGNLLWTGSRMMLAEHRQRLNQRHKEQYVETDICMEVDEQQLEEWQHTLQTIAKNENAGILIIYGIKKEVRGSLIAWDSSDHSIYIRNKEGDRIKISYEEIKHIEGFGL